MLPGLTSLMMHRVGGCLRMTSSDWFASGCRICSPIITCIDLHEAEDGVTVDKSLLGSGLGMEVIAKRANPKLT